MKKKTPMEIMKEQVIELMETVTPSSEELEVREYLMPILVGKCGDENVWVDENGNLFGQYTQGDGSGGTVILSAHMDSVDNYATNHTIVETTEGKLFAPGGICGADDKAGIAIVLAASRELAKVDTFNGVIKFAFFVSEEVGCVGSSAAIRNEHTKAWLTEADLGIVVDRKGNRDIVVGNFSSAFCSTEVGKFFEEASALQDMDWKATPGGISDTGSLARVGINAVNLSAGYYNEHTKNEYVVVSEMWDTVKLIVQAVTILKDHKDKFGEVPEENEWCKSYSYGGRGSYYYRHGSMWDEQWLNDMEMDFRREASGLPIVRVSSAHGKVELFDMGDVVYISQGQGATSQEFVMSREEFGRFLQKSYEVLFLNETYDDSLEDVEEEDQECEEQETTGVNLNKNV